MSFTERAGLIPILLLTGCAQPAVYTGPPSGSVVDNMLSRSAADISAMQYRVHQSGPSAHRPIPPAGTKSGSPLLTATTGSSHLSGKVSSQQPASLTGGGPADGFVRQNGAAPTLRAALRKIVPPGQTVVFDKAVSADAPALWRWTGNDRWRYVVDKMLSVRDLQATVNEKSRTVTVEPAQRAQSAPASGSVVSPPVPPGKPADRAKASLSPATGRNPFRGDKAVVSSPTARPMGASVPAPRTSVVPVTAPAVIQLRHWRIETGSTVKDWLYTQAAAETCTVPGIKNWTIAWLTPTNYRVDAPLKFDGSFREMLNRLFTLYGTAKVPLYAGVRAAQCVVTVDDKEVQ